MSVRPYEGIRVLEFAGLGAAPFACSLLADAGAEVIRIERPGSAATRPSFTLRGRTTVEADLKSEEDRAFVYELAASADVLVDGFRPGVMERLGFGPDKLTVANTALVYARMTGWGQTGPAAHEPGHDLSYLAMVGAARSIAREGHDPVPPLNMVADYGGGLMLAYGIGLALFERTRSGTGQVIDAAMTDAALLLMSGLWQRKADGQWSDVPGTNDMDSGAPHYNSYRTSDRHYMAVAGAEPKFYANMTRILGLEDALDGAREDRTKWPAAKQKIAQAFATRTRAEWTELFAGAEACVAPVNAVDEVASDPHVRARSMLVERDGAVFPAAAPRMSRTGPELSDTGARRIDLATAAHNWCTPAIPTSTH
ncbi:CaiB/BaiF CoA transferase family protein [Rhodococcus jostii]|uniref:Alpha-methylacyl-CoA racemase n=1 Tax=Rhodococcus jostii TaxID=132919 RepID=A0A1H4SEV7_RHOJO|nr:CaiB/BaiF CoA-transferase family protein [Rhodococcus jostii]SEC42623.1 alpha-methylacyl-CoA racemase [Rhodococcus jostii]